MASIAKCCLPEKYSLFRSRLRRLFIVGPDIYTVTAMREQPSPIRPLTDQLINQIAAGEVISRPASVVKELIENAIDANATRIDIDIYDGGIARVQVRDDGAGIAADDLALAVTRHCTSKLVTSADLSAIYSLGFRGEALASIAAVARLNLTSRPREAELGMVITCRPEEKPSTPQPESHPPGTTVEVLDLFARLPARRRFLKRAQTEYLHVQQSVRRAAFCHPAIRFRLCRDGRRVLDLPAVRDASTAQRRWRALFGSGFARDANAVDLRATSLRVHGWVASEALARSSADLQFLAVNGRTVRDRQLAHAVRLAYGDRLAKGRYPAYALHIELPVSEVDVNVHPEKAEVRFHRVREVHDVLLKAVRTGLESRTAVSSVAGSDAAASPVTPLEVREKDAEVRVTAAPPPVAPWRLIAPSYAVQIECDVLTLIDLGGLQQAVLAAHFNRLETPASEAVTTRPLLFPVVLKAPTDTARLARWGRWGVMFNSSHDDTYTLQAVPAILPELDAAGFAEKLLASGDGEPAPHALIAAALASLLWPSIPPAVQAYVQRLLTQATDLALNVADFQRLLDACELQRLFKSAPL